ncbi:MAG: thiamine phosphate synthase [Rhodospirillales bacterium]|nr:thiamine phosphate synthase [Rhodospirillales bacterium]
MTDTKRLFDPIPAARRLPEGAAVLLRHYDSEDKYALAHKLKQICVNGKLRLIVAEDVALANEIGADGLHLTERSARRAGHLLSWKLRPGSLLTVSAHSPAALRQAAAIGADAALLSSVFPTKSHLGGTPLGPRLLASWIRTAPLPVYALGGISVSNAGRLMGSGAAGIAGIGGFT